jgi:hypothetical protein
MEGGDERMPLERRLYDAALYARPAAVNEAYFPQTRRVRGADVLIHHRRDVARMKGMEIEDVFDGDAMDLVGGVRHGVTAPRARCLFPVPRPSSRTWPSRPC